MDGAGWSSAETRLVKRLANIANDVVSHSAPLAAISSVAFVADDDCNSTDRSKSYVHSSTAIGLSSNRSAPEAIAHWAFRHTQDMVSTLTMPPSRALYTYSEHY